MTTDFNAVEVLATLGTDSSQQLVSPQQQLASMKERIASLEAQVASLNAQVASLNAQVASHPRGSDHTVKSGPIRRQFGGDQSSVYKFVQARANNFTLWKNTITDATLNNPLVFQVDHDNWSVVLKAGVSGNQIAEILEIGRTRRQHIREVVRTNNTDTGNRRHVRGWCIKELDEIHPRPLAFEDQGH